MSLSIQGIEAFVQTCYYFIASVVLCLFCVRMVINMNKKKRISSGYEQIEEEEEEGEKLKVGLFYLPQIPV